MGKFANSKALAGASFGVLKSEKKLAAIPAVSALTCGVIAVAVGGGVVLTADFIANPAPGQDDFSLTTANRQPDGKGTRKTTTTTADAMATITSERDRTEPGT